MSNRNMRNIDKVKMNVIPFLNFSVGPQVASGFRREAMQTVYAININLQDLCLPLQFHANTNLHMPR